MLGVYIIICKDRAYVGQSSDITGRIYEHRRLLRLGRHSNTLMQRYWNKYQEKCFSFTHLVECDSVKESLLAEEFFISMLGTYDRGFNFTTGGDKSPMLSERVRLKLVKNSTWRKNLLASLQVWTRSRKHKEHLKRLHKSEAYKAGCSLGGKRSLFKPGHPYSSKGGLNGWTPERRRQQALRMQKVVRGNKK